MRKLVALSLLTALLGVGGAASAHERGHRREQPAPAAVYKYGAVAYSPSSGVFAPAAGYGDVNSAEVAAVQLCGQGDCQIVTWEGNGCVAFATAISGDGNWGASGVKDNLGDAQREAVTTCGGSGDVCSVATWSCF